MEASAATPAAPSRAQFVSDRLASFLAVAPLGVWTISHLWDNLAVFEDATGTAWQARVTGQSGIGLAITTVVVVAPLLLHTVWGIRRIAKARPNNQRYGFFENLKFLLQRLSAVGLLLFIGAHMWLAFLSPRLVHGHPEPFKDIAAQMHHHGPTLGVYLLGTLAVSYHLANGLATWAMGFGLVSSRASLRKAERLSYVLFGVMLAMAWGAIYGLWAAGSAFPAQPH
jgi:succinate dehydrogenase / fumarate reductase cytochrome b subunit